MPDTSDQQSEYSKGINLLPEDLRREVKASATAPKRPRMSHPEKPQGKPVPEPKIPKPKKEEKKSSWFSRFTKHKDNSPEPPQEEPAAEKPLLFKVSNKPSLDISVKESSGDDTINLLEQTPPEPPTEPASEPPEESKQPKTKPPAEPEPAPEPEIDLLSKTEDTKSEEKQESAQAEKEEGTKEKKSDKQKHKHVSFSSIKELVDSDEDETPDSGGFDVDLIPSELRTEGKNKNAYIRLGVAAVISILVVLGAYFGIGFTVRQNEQQIADLQAQVEYYESEVTKAQETLAQLSDFVKQTQVIGELLKGQRRWTKLFAFLEEQTLPEVYYKNVAATTDNIVVLSVVAKSYHDVVRQYMVFAENQDISDIKLSGARLDDSLWKDYLDVLDQQLEAQASGEDVPIPDLDINFNEVKDYIQVETTISFKLNSLPKLE